MHPFDVFFRKFTDNLLKSIDIGDTGEALRPFRIPEAALAVGPESPDPLHPIFPCRVMVFPKEEMLAAYIHFFVERGRDLRGEEGPPGSLTPLSIVKRLLEDFDYIDREHLCLLFDETPPHFERDVPAQETFLIIPHSPHSARPCPVRGKPVMLSRDDHHFRYGEALAALSRPSLVSGPKSGEKRSTVFCRFMLKEIGKKDMYDGA